jgi:hypothetical protein
VGPLSEGSRLWWGTPDLMTCAEVLFFEVRLYLTLSKQTAILDRNQVIIIGNNNNVKKSTKVSITYSQ